MKNRLNAVLSGITLLGLCASMPLEAKETTFDKAAYLDANFSSQNLSPEVREYITKDAPLPLRFKTVEVKSNVEIDDGKNKKAGPTIVSTYANAEGGLVKEIHEYSNKDVPSGTQLAMSYAGIFKLRSQNIRDNDPNATLIIEAKQIAHFAKGLDQLKEKKDYLFEVKSAAAAESQLFNSVKVVCRAGKSFAASTLHPKISGKATELSCENYYNDKLTGKTKYAVLQQSGLALTTEHQMGPTTFRYKVTEVKGLELLTQ